MPKHVRRGARAPRPGYFPFCIITQGSLILKSNSPDILPDLRLQFRPEEIRQIPTLSQKAGSRGGHEDLIRNSCDRSGIPDTCRSIAKAMVGPG